VKSIWHEVTLVARKNTAKLVHKVQGTKEIQNNIVKQAAKVDPSNDFQYKQKKIGRVDALPIFVINITVNFL
jgi:hypothetical protein